MENDTGMYFYDIIDIKKEVVTRDNHHRMGTRQKTTSSSSIICRKTKKVKKFLKSFRNYHFISEDDKELLWLNVLRIQVSKF